MRILLQSTAEQPGSNQNHAAITQCKVLDKKASCCQPNRSLFDLESWLGSHPRPQNCVSKQVDFSIHCMQNLSQSAPSSVKEMLATSNGLVASFAGFHHISIAWEHQKKGQSISQQNRQKTGVGKHSQFRAGQSVVQGVLVVPVCEMLSKHFASVGQLVTQCQGQAVSCEMPDEQGKGVQL